MSKLFLWFFPGFARDTLRAKLEPIPSVRETNESQEKTSNP